MEYRIFLESINIDEFGVKSKQQYDAIISKNKFDKIYSIVKNNDN